MTRQRWEWEPHQLLSAGSVSEGVVSGIAQSSESMRHSLSSCSPVLLSEFIIPEFHIPNFGAHDL